MQRPQELTREELRQLRLALEAEGFTDSKIKRAWVDATNQDIAASIMGHSRQAAIGDASRFHVRNTLLTVPGKSRGGRR